MKITVIALSLLLPAIAFAQEMPSLNQADVENMMKNLKGMESCMQNIDEKKLDELKRGAEQVESEVDDLCRAGKRSQAQTKAISYGKEMENDPTMKAMMKCIEPMKGMMKSIPMMPFDEVIENSDTHVCD
ncbi:MAG: hypothetical protein RQ936_02125 [Gammaproteobacteria bacterium]|nr:hypothetical protein [Gammaproteobacteria bacterium]